MMHLWLAAGVLDGPRAPVAPDAPASTLTGFHRPRKPVWRKLDEVKAIIEAERAKVEHRPFDELLLLADPVVSQNATSRDISRQSIVNDIASAVGEIVEEQPKRIAEAAAQHAVETISAAVDAFDLDDEEEETLIALLWANGALRALMRLH
jgi:hypothetical protein